MLIAKYSKLLFLIFTLLLFTSFAFAQNVASASWNLVPPDSQGVSSASGLITASPAAGKIILEKVTYPIIIKVLQGTQGKGVLFADSFGAEPWIAVRFDKVKWFFLSIEDLKFTGKYYAASQELAKAKGLLFEELIQSNADIFS